MATLASMPIELLVHIIATYLTTKDLGALRLTSKYFEKALFDTFAKEFFTKKQFMLTTPSLTALVDISKHAALSKFVRHVIIGLEQYAPQTYRHITDPVQLQKYLDGCDDQDLLVHTGGGRQLLAEAFRNLPNLETVGIRDYSAYGRVRDGARWHSYGAPTVRAETGVSLTCNPHHMDLFEFPSIIYSTLLLALSDARAVVPNIEVILRNSGAGLTDNAFHLSSHSLSNLEPVLAGLHTLLLTLKVQTMNPVFNQMLSEFSQNPAQGPPRSINLGSFLAQTKNLTHLRLNFQNREQLMDAVLLRLLCQSNYQDLLPRLEKLEFGMLAAAPELLLEFIAKFASTLRFISFWKVRLLPTPGYQSTDDKPNRWRNFLLHVSRLDNLNLTGIMLGLLDQSYPAGFGVHTPAVHIQFSNYAEDEVLAEGQPDPWEKIRECSGDMKTFLPRLISQVRVKWPDPPVVAETESENNEDEDEEMADDDENEDDDEDDEDGDDEE